LKSRAALPLIIALLAVLTVAKLFLAARIELIPEEAYYWTYWKFPALGYFDHPPMVAWLVGLGTTIFGDTEIGVRFGTVMIFLGSCALIFATSRIWFGEFVATWTVLLFVLPPIFAGIGFFVTPDAPLVFFWLLTLFAISKALQTHRAGFWILAGVALGGGLLSKYYAVLLVPSLLLFFVFAPNHRFWLRRWEPWLAVVVALAVFSPVIVWNAEHRWASFLFQSTRTIGHKNRAFRDNWEFWVVQMGMLTPLVFALFVRAAGRAIHRGWRGRNEAWNFAAAFCLPLFGLFVAASFKTEIHINWTSPAFLSMTPAAAAIFVECASTERTQRRKLWRILGWVNALVCLTVIGIGFGVLGWGKPQIFAYSRAGGWKPMAQHAMIAQSELAARTGQQPFLLGMDRYNLAAELTFYTGQIGNCVNTFAVGEHGLGFRYWIDLHRFEGRPAVAVLTSSNETTIAQLSAHFSKLDEPRELNLHGSGGLSRRIYLVQCHDYHIARTNEPHPPSLTTSRPRL
jgi:dolichol-phosphate mannosyltransferase